MPYQWLEPEGDTRRLHLWPHRSLPRRGLVGFMAATVALVAVPVLTVFGTPVLWGVLPFVAAAVWGLGRALGQSYRDREILEELTLAPGRMRLVRHGPRGRRQDWEANPHWVRPVLHAAGGPVESYLTLRGGPREVELGAFLAPGERVALAAELGAALAGLRG